jgi:hypothetical protein
VLISSLKLTFRPCTTRSSQLSGDYAFSANTHQRDQVRVREVHDFFHLDQRVEVGMMADIFLGWIGQKLFYVILCVRSSHAFLPRCRFVLLLLVLTVHSPKVYLFGDLAIYAVYVPRSLVTVTGTALAL